jgi:hypothetical protein
MDNVKKKICYNVLEGLFNHYLENFGEEKIEPFDFNDDIRYSAISYLSEKNFIKHFDNLKKNQISYTITKEGIEFLILKKRYEGI